MTELSPEFRAAVRSGLDTAGSDQNPALPPRWYRAHWTYQVIQEIYDEIKRSYGQEERQSLAPLGDAALDHEARMRPEAPQQADQGGDGRRQARTQGS